MSLTNSPRIAAEIEGHRRIPLIISYPYCVGTLLAYLETLENQEQEELREFLEKIAKLEGVRNFLEKSVESGLDLKLILDHIRNIVDLRPEFRAVALELLEHRQLQDQSLTPELKKTMALLAMTHPIKLAEEMVVSSNAILSLTGNLRGNFIQAISPGINNKSPDSLIDALQIADFYVYLDTYPADISSAFFDLVERQKHLEGVKNMYYYLAALGNLPKNLRDFVYDRLNIISSDAIKENIKSDGIEWYNREGLPEEEVLERCAHEAVIEQSHFLARLLVPLSKLSPYLQNAFLKAWNTQSQRAIDDDIDDVREFDYDFIKGEEAVLSYMKEIYGDELKDFLGMMMDMSFFTAFSNLHPQLKAMFEEYIASDDENLSRLTGIYNNFCLEGEWKIFMNFKGKDDDDLRKTLTSYPDLLEIFEKYQTSPLNSTEVIEQTRDKALKAVNSNIRRSESE